MIVRISAFCPVGRHDIEIKLKRVQEAEQLLELICLAVDFHLTAGYELPQLCLAQDDGVQVGAGERHRAMGVFRLFALGVVQDGVFHRHQILLLGVADGKDQRAFFEGKQEKSAREGFPYWMNSKLYGVKWGNFKMKLVDQKYLTDPARELATPHLINLVVDPKERESYTYPHLHSWVLRHTGKILREFEESVQREPLIPLGAALDYVPGGKK